MRIGKLLPGVLVGCCLVLPPVRSSAENSASPELAGESHRARKPQENKGLWHPHLVVPPESDAAATPAYRYANMSNVEVERELVRRKIDFDKLTDIPGAKFPIRLGGRLRGVWVHSVLPANERKESPYEILDGRLALALDDFCGLLAAHGFVELIHYTMYRPPANGHGKEGESLHRHPAGMAIDLGALKRDDGTLFSVARDWPAEIGAKTCGDGGRDLLTRRGRELLSLACEAQDQRIFHYALTPHHDDRHKDHLHLEIKEKIRWFLVE